MVGLCLFSIPTVRCIFYPLQIINVRIQFKEHNIIINRYLYYWVTTTQNILCRYKLQKKSYSA